MFKTFADKIGEFKKETIMTPLFMVMEVLMECIIPVTMVSVSISCYLGIMFNKLFWLYIWGADMHTSIPAVRYFADDNCQKTSIVCDLLLSATRFPIPEDVPLKMVKNNVDNFVIIIT